MPTEQQIDKLFDDAKVLFKRKLADYGTQDITEMGDDDMQRMQVILSTRLNEKRLRALNILKNPQSRLQEEPLRDTFLDGMGYNAILTFLCDGVWEASSTTPQIGERKEDTVLNQENISKMPGEDRLEAAQLMDYLRIQRIDAELTPVHTPKLPGDVGFDLEVCKDTWVWPVWMTGGKAVIVPSAAKMKIPDGYWCQIVGRSSSANKKGLLVHTATIDNHYTGQLFACCFNLSLLPKRVKKGERLAQMVFHRMNVPELSHVFDLPKTERSEQGFGSTGK